MHSIVTLRPSPQLRDTLSHLPAPRLRQAGRMREGGGSPPLCVHVHRAVQKGTGDLARQRRTTESANPRRFWLHTTITRTLAQARILGFVCFIRSLAKGHCSVSAARGRQPEQHELGFAVGSDFAGSLPGTLQRCAAAPAQRDDPCVRRHQRYTSGPFTLVAVLSRCVRTQVCVS